MKRSGRAQRCPCPGAPYGSIGFGAPARAVRVRDDRAADAVQSGCDRVSGQPRGETLQPLLVTRKRRRRSRHAPARRLGCSSQVGLRGGRVADEQAHQLAAPVAALSLEPRASLRVALDRVGRELLDVGEDRLREQAEHLGVDPRARGGGRQAPPGDPGADAVGRLEGVERAALPQLPGAERRVHLAAGTAFPGRASDQFDELPQRLGYAGAHALPERPLQRARVVRDLERDRGEDLVSGRLELGLDQIGDLGRQRAPGLGLARSCHSSE